MMVARKFTVYKGSMDSLTCITAIVWLRYVVIDHGSISIYK